MAEDEFPNNDAYLVLKTEVLRIFGPRPSEAVERALNRVLVGKPSQLARAIIRDICKNKLDCQCCPAVVETLWKRHLSSAVRAGVAHMTFNKTNLNALLELADDIHANTSQNSSASATVAAMSLNETQPALPYPVPEVSAVSRGGGRGGGRGGQFRGSGRGGRGGRGNRGGSGSGGNSGGGGSQPSQPRHKGTKHPDLPPGDWQGCNMHFKWGRGSYFCTEPTTCPWKNIVAPKPEK